MPYATWLAPRQKNHSWPLRGRAVLLAPPVLTGRREGVDRVVVRVLAGQRFLVGVLEGGAVVLGPVGDAAFPVVLGEHVHPPLADEGDVAHDPGRGVPREVAHDVVLELLGLPDRHAP